MKEKYVYQVFCYKKDGSVEWYTGKGWNEYYGYARFYSSETKADKIAKELSKKTSNKNREINISAHPVY
jgi:hypothetical protein